MSNRRYEALIKSRLHSLACDRTPATKVVDDIINDALEIYFQYEPEILALKDHWEEKRIG